MANSRKQWGPASPATWPRPEAQKRVKNGQKLSKNVKNRKFFQKSRKNFPDRGAVRLKKNFYHYNEYPDNEHCFFLYFLKPPVPISFAILR